MAWSQGREPREGAELTSCGSDSRQQACSGARCRQWVVPPPWSLDHTQGGLTPLSIGGQVTPLWGCLFPHIFSHPSVLEISLTLKVTSFRILASTIGLICHDEFMAFPSLG